MHTETKRPTNMGVSRLIGMISKYELPYVDAVARCCAFTGHGRVLSRSPSPTSCGWIVTFTPEQEIES